MITQRAPFILLSTCCAVVFFSLLANPLPVLDEEGYLVIAEQMSWGRPYDWQLPWPPFDEENAYIYAHPPLFLWMIKLGRSYFSLEALQWVLAIPWQVLLSASVAWLAFEQLKKPWYAVLLWMGMAGVALPCTRSLMPDLQVAALASFSMVLWLCGPRGFWWTFLSGMILGLAAWTKYPALLLMIVPLIHAKESREWLGFVSGVILIVGAGELWLYGLYDSIHLVEVIKRAPEIARGPLESRLVGIFNRVPISAFGVILLTLLIPRKMKYFLLGVMATISMYIAQNLGVEQVYLAGVLGAIGAQILRVSIGRTSLHTWAWVVLFGVLIAHNYASPRYWLLSMAPLSILVVQQIPGGVFKSIAIGGSMLISIVLAKTEKFHAEEGQRLAVVAHQEFPDRHFSGEWTFRWQMRELGATHVRDLHPDVVLVAQESAGGLSQPDQYQLERTFWGQQHQLHLISAPDSVGYYADTLGYWPVMWRDSAVEQVQVWKLK